MIIISDMFSHHRWRNDSSHEKNVSYVFVFGGDDDDGRREEWMDDNWVKWCFSNFGVCMNFDIWIIDDGFSALSDDDDDDDLSNRYSLPRWRFRWWEGEGEEGGGGGGLADDGRKCKYSVSTTRRYNDGAN